MKTPKRPNPFGPEVEPAADGAPALPLWIGGRAYLTMPADGFFDLRGPGGVLRRVPLCDESAVDAAVDAAINAGSSDPDSTETRAALRQLWARFAAHVAKLLAEEGGAQVDAAREVDEVTALLDDAGTWQSSRGRLIVAVIAGAEAPLAQPVRAILEALAAGGSVIVRPSLRAPSALLAFVELLTRAGLTDGRANLVHGDDKVVAALCANPRIDELRVSGDGEVAARVAALAGQAGKPHRQINAG